MWQLIITLVVLLCCVGFYWYRKLKVNKHLYKHLLELKAGKITYTQYGICYNIPAYGIAGEVLQGMIRDWAKLNPIPYKNIKSEEYPVGGFSEYVNESIDGTLWKNPRRLELLDYLIERTKP